MIRSRTRSFAAAFAATAFIALAGCNTAVGPEQREQIVQGCITGATRTGVTAQQAQQLCGCTADKAVEQKLTLLEMNGDKGKAIAQECAMQLVQQMQGQAPATGAPAAK